MKIGLVTPYVYPLPGGVNQHVRYLYENLRLRGHDVRILTSSHGLQRASDGDVIRIGKGFSMPANGSVGTITCRRASCPRCTPCSTASSSTCSTSTSRSCPSCRSIVLGQSNSVNVATFHAFGGFSPAYTIGASADGSVADRIHGRIAVCAAARHFIERFFPGDYKVIPNGVDVDRFQRAVPIARWQDGTRNILFVGRFESRKGLLAPAQGVPDPAQGRRDCRLLVVGGGPQENEMRRYLMTRRLGGVEFLGKVRDDERDALFKTADIYCSPATGRELFGIVLLEAMAAGTAIVASDIHGYKGVVRRGREACWSRRGTRRRSPERSPSSWPTTTSASSMAESGLERAQEFSWERVTAKVEDYYGFVIRRLAAQGELPARVPGRGAAVARRAAGPQSSRMGASEAPAARVADSASGGGFVARLDGGAPSSANSPAASAGSGSSSEAMLGLRATGMLALIRFDRVVRLT